MMIEGLLPSATEIDFVSRAELDLLWDIVLSPYHLQVVNFSLENGILEDINKGVDALAYCTKKSREVGHQIDVIVCFLEHIGLVVSREGKLQLTDPARKLLLRSSRLNLATLCSDHAIFLKGFPYFKELFTSGLEQARPLWSTLASLEELKAHFARRVPFEESRRPYRWSSAWLLVRPYLRRRLSDFRRVCDLGSGPGAFAAQLVAVAPDLHALAVDINFGYTEYLKTSLDDIASLPASLRERVTLQACNVMHDRVPESELYTANRFISGLSRVAARGWLEKIFAEMPAGSVFAGCDFFLSGNAEHDRFTSRLFIYNVSYGQSLMADKNNQLPTRSEVTWNPPWSFLELRTLFTEVGFTDFYCEEADGPMGYIEVRRP
jgi:hypothetical protein